MDLECIGCGEVFHLESVGRRRPSKPPGHKGGRQDDGHGHALDPGFYNFRTGRFTCPSCGLTVAVGVLVFFVEGGPGSKVHDNGQFGESPQCPPPDWTPTYAQALALRNQTAGNAIYTRSAAWMDPHNSVVRATCRCQIIAKPGSPGPHGKGPRKFKTRFIPSAECPIHGGQATQADVPR